MFEILTLALILTTQPFRITITRVAGILFRIAKAKKARWLGFFSHQLSWHPPSREAGTTSAEPSVRVAGAAGWLLSIITSHAPGDGCTRCAPAIVDGCNGCGPAILPKMAAI